MCTRFQITAKDGSVLVCRTMDFAKSVGDNYQEFRTDGFISFKGKYSSYGLPWLKEDVICDGLNKEGLSLEALWLPSPYTKYNVSLDTKAFSRTINLPRDILRSCKTVAEAKALFSGFIAHVPSEYIANLLTIHLAISDKSGKSIVVEFNEKNGKAGKPIIYDNPLGVLTNAPGYEWHRTNLNNWLHIGVNNVVQKDILGAEHHALGFGNNLMSLPGDITPPSRYIVTNILLDLAYKYEQPKTIKHARLLADKIAGKISVIRGTSITKGRFEDEVDYTQWIVLKDLKNYQYLQKKHDSLNYEEL